MNYNFTGSVTQRRINLGSANEITSTQLTQQAREERALRLEIRQKNLAATKIQSVYRGRKEASRARQRLKRLFFDAVADGDFLQATRSIALATRRRSVFDRLTSAGRAAKLTHHEVNALREDDSLLRSWTSLALQRGNGDGTPRILVEAKNMHESFLSSLQEVLRTVLGHSRYQDAPTQKDSQMYIDLLHILIIAPAGRRDAGASNSAVIAIDWCEWLVHNAIYESLRAHLLSISLATKSPPKVLKYISDLILQPLKRVSAVPIIDQHKRTKLIDIVINDVLSISDLPSRISRSDLTQMVLELPLLEIVERIPHLIRASSLTPDSISLLANILAIGCKRVMHFTKGSQLNAYLMALSVLQDSIPSGMLQLTGDFRRKSNGRTTMEALDQEGQASNGSSDVKSILTNSTMSRLQILPSQDHISSILTTSAKYASSTRESFCAFLVSTLQSWDPITKDHILACITYRHSPLSNGSTAINKNTGISSHSIEGLVREVWRGWFRGSHLARFLAKDLLQGRKSLLAILGDDKAKSSWPCLLILCQLYSRSLLTIGDDEFYPAESSFSTSSTSTTQNASRNPLSIDEIIALSALLRNLAFSLYWYEGTGGALNDMSRNHIVGVRKMDLLSLRDIVTRLLQQLHQRDSRRSFAPRDHWLMNSHLDLNSFIQSVVMEEQELNKHAEENGDMSHMEIDPMHDDNEMEIEGDEGISRSAISARIANRSRGSIRNGTAKLGFSARSLAYLSPRLGILNNVPFMIPFEVRVEIFHQFTAMDYAKVAHLGDQGRPPREVSIRRTHVAEDGFTQLNGLGPNLKHRFAIKFIDQFGIEESGIDGGGLFKEFLTSLVKEAFDTDRGLWSATSDQQLYPNPHSYAKMDDSLQWYRFLGRILGKALYHGILVDVNFASFFLSKWLGKGNSYLDDLSGLESLDKEVYRNLLWLKHYTGDIEKDLSLDFTVTDEEFGVKQIHELIPNGRNVAVTRENRLEYIYRVSHYKLNEQIRPQSEAFLSGLTDVIDLRWLRMLNREELRILISGSEGEIDLDDLRKHTVLGSYHEKDEAIEYFWKSLESFTQSQRKAFLKFVTSCPSPPLLGFGQLNPNFGIRNGGDDTSRLPSSSTCVNLLKLPRYTTYEQCREKLLYAIESGAGFDLS